MRLCRTPISPRTSKPPLMPTENRWIRRHGISSRKTTSSGEYSSPIGV